MLLHLHLAFSDGEVLLLQLVLLWLLLLLLCCWHGDGGVSVGGLGLFGRPRAFVDCLSSRFSSHGEGRTGSRSVVVVELVLLLLLLSVR